MVEPARECQHCHLFITDSESGAHAAFHEREDALSESATELSDPSTADSLGYSKIAPYGEDAALVPPESDHICTDHCAGHHVRLMCEKETRLLSAARTGQSADVEAILRSTPMQCSTEEMDFVGVATLGVHEHSPR